MEKWHKGPTPKYLQNRKFHLKDFGDVTPINGEDHELMKVHYPSWSHGITHFLTEDGEIYFCGIEWFEDHAE